MLKQLRNLLGGHRKIDPGVEKLLRSIISRSREPVFFRDLHVPDTLEGRFDILVLHLYLVLKRLKDETEPARNTAQLLFDAFLLDLDTNLRAAGVSDIRIGKQMKKRVADIYGRIEAYDSALDGSDMEALKDSLDRNLFQDTESRPEDLATLADYLHGQWLHISGVSVDDIVAGDLRFESLPASRSVEEGP